ncbi:hypothetical protein EG68_08321 [Paragonimus skrjabini miyazakii]|uniref:DDHD domain-containing protein n=1 Tax=Paragonimus skrjabini miyazakii TaxID=59628 RepID=A0A8S9YDC3_9TREM|nr:hypothetical protein EG68_08321 [Paragonimus skrjabini miyazakii]
MRSSLSGKAGADSRVTTFSGLTMNINRASLPTVPCILTQPALPVEEESLSSFVGQEGDTRRETGSISGLTCEQSDSTVMIDIPKPPTVPSSSVGCSVRTCNRQRYVLPPGMLTTSQTSTQNPTQSSVVVPPFTTASVPPQQDVQLLPSKHEQYLSVEQMNSLSAAPLFSPAPCEPVTGFWFYATQVNGSKIWWPFSRHDSYQLEKEARNSNFLCLSSVVILDQAEVKNVDDVAVSVEGGRYDVYLACRQRRAVYWDEPVTEVRRATWFYRSPNENRVLPFSELVCELLEVRYKEAAEQGIWGQRFEVPADDKRGGHDYFIFHNPESMIQYRAWPHSYAVPLYQTDSGSSPELTDDSQLKLSALASDSGHDNRICYVRRGLDSSLLEQLEDGEFRSVDHVFFVVHGIGAVYNLKGQGLVDCVNGLRRTAHSITKSHFPTHDKRAEFLPIMWHDELHSDATGVDSQLNQITLRSIPKLRQFTNGTLMDILFYTSSKYCQVIVDTVAKDICRLRDLFLSRNPGYNGGFSIIGHSLGAVIVFDLLAHQRIPSHDQSEQCEESLVAISEDVSEELEFNDVTPHVTHSLKDQTPAMVSIDKSGRSSSLGAAGEGWSMVGHQDDSKQVLPVDDEDVEERLVTSRKLETSTDLHKLSDLLTEVGLTKDQINQVLTSWTNEKSKSDNPLSSSGLSDASDPSVRRPSFWSETLHDPLSGGFGMPVVIYPQLGFPITAFFMLGSPLALFLTARGIRQLAPDYHLPMCSMCFNIYHPFDPVAYRMETLIDPTFQPRAVLVPHHKGRKRLHLQLRDNLARVGSDLKTKLYQSVHATWRTIQEFAMSHRFIGTQAEDVGGESEDASSFSRFMSGLDTQPGERDDAGSCASEDELGFNGQLNNGRRIDYVLQEAPLESFSDYLFALGSHAAYWESEDTSLFLLTEVYSTQCVAPTALSQKFTKQTAISEPPCNDVSKRSSALQPMLFNTPSNLPPVIPQAGISAYSPNTSELTYACASQLPSMSSEMSSFPVTNQSSAASRETHMFKPTSTSSSSPSPSTSVCTSPPTAVHFGVHHACENLGANVLSPPSHGQLLGSSDGHPNTGIAIFPTYQQRRQRPNFSYTVPAYQLYQPTQSDVNPTQFQPSVGPTTGSTVHVDGPHSMHPSGGVPPFTLFTASALPSPAQLAATRHHLAPPQLSFSTTVAGHSLGTVPVLNSPLPMKHTFPGS